jgi:hypothetical protein
MKLSDLLQEQAQLQESVLAVRSLMETENRLMNEDETKQIEEVTRKLAELEVNIAAIKTAEEIARSAKPIEVVKPNEQNKVEMKSLELVRELANAGRQTDNVIKRNSELGEGIASMGVFVERNYSFGTNGANLSPVQVGSLNVLEGTPDLYAQLGATIFGDLKGSTQVLPFMDAFAGQAVAEKGTITRDTTATNSVTLSPARVGIQIEVTREGLATFSEGTWNGVLQNAYKAIDRKITANVYAAVLAGATEVAAATALDKASFDLLEAAVPVDGIYMMRRPTFFGAKGVKIDTGSGLFLAQRVGQDKGQTYEGTPIFHSGYFVDGANKKYVFYGVPGNIAIGFWGQDAYEVIVDHLTKAADGKLVITISKIVDVKIPNVAKAFVRTVDLDPA